MYTRYSWTLVEIEMLERQNACQNACLKVHVAVLVSINVVEYSLGMSVIP